MLSLKCLAVVSVLMVAWPPLASGQQVIIPGAYRKYDRDGDAWLTKSELIQFAKGEDPKRSDEQAADVADDILTFQCSVNCARISFDDFIIFLQDRNRRQGQVARTKRNPFWRGFGIGREVVDAVNPRGQKTKAPAVVSIKWDREAAESKNKRQESLLGAVQLLAARFGQGATSLGITPGVDFDIDGAKPANETTISFGAPLNVLRVREPDDFVESFTIGVTPKFITDRVFKRDVNELAINGSLNSKPIGAGFIRPAPVRRDGVHLPKLMWYWVPSVQFEFGKVRDAGGNAKLVPLEGKGYSRVAPRAKLTFFPNVVSEQLRLEIDYTSRFDLGENWNRYYAEGRLSYDLVFKGVAELTLVHRRGRKPPQFTKLNDLLFGVGLKL